MREIEVKLRINNLSVLESALKENGCVLSSPIHQHDIIYSRGGTSEWESAKEGDIILRIRNQDDRAEFNLKQQKSSELDNLEYETGVEDAESLHKILLVLGWHPEVEVKKIRRKGNFREYEICLDEVEELGNFVELEKLTTDDADPHKVQEELLNAMELLGVPRSSLEVRGYDTMIFQLHAGI
jgi:adenylate cyclase class 2